MLLAEFIVAYELTIVQKAGYLHGIVNGQNSREAVTDYLMRGLQECIAGGFSHVLIETRLQGPRLALWEIFEIAAEHSKLDFGRFDAIAYVDTSAPADLLTFIQNVSRNRGLPVRVFNLVATAEQWLATKLAERSCPADADK
jgi:hypothetical protein